jgi:hypothetical protein
VTGFLLFELAAIGNIRLLIAADAIADRAARHVRAGVAVLLGPDGASCTEEPVVREMAEVPVAWLPPPDETRAVVDRFGDPRQDVLVPWAVVEPTDEDDAFARRLLCPSAT